MEAAAGTTPRLGSERFDIFPNTVPMYITNWFVWVRRFKSLVLQKYTQLHSCLAMPPYGAKIDENFASHLFFFCGEETHAKKKDDSASSFEEQ